MLRGLGMVMNDDKHSSCSAMSKLSDVCDQIPEVYCISKYIGTGKESNQKL